MNRVGRPEKVERNKQIVNDKLNNGLSYRDLMIKYDLSQTSIRRILLRYNAINVKNN